MYRTVKAVNEKFQYDKKLTRKVLEVLLINDQIRSRYKKGLTEGIIKNWPIEKIISATYVNGYGPFIFIDDIYEGPGNFKSKFDDKTQIKLKPNQVSCMITCNNITYASQNLFIFNKDENHDLVLIENILIDHYEIDE